jgi:hypothetical protein
MKKLDRTDDELVREEIDKRVVELEASRVLNTTWLHVDMDGTYSRTDTVSTDLSTSVQKNC